MDYAKKKSKALQNVANPWRREFKPVISEAVDKIMQILNENTIGKLLHLTNRYLVEQPLWKLAVGTQGMSCKKNFICP